MKRKKLTIDLGNTGLNDAQMKKLLGQIHSLVNGNLPVVKKQAHAKNKKTVKSGNETVILPDTAATIKATFTNVNPGLSELKATFNGVTKKLSQTGDIVFNNIGSGDVIIIQGKSLGTSEISIDVKASPQQMKFVPGTFNFNFFII